MKINNFDDAKQIDDMMSSDIGTPIYKAPEIWRQETYDSKVDVWSIGVVFYELFYGESPFKDCSTYNEIMITNFQKLFPVEDKPITDECYNFLKSCLEIDTEF